MNKTCGDEAWEEYVYWQGQDRKTLQELEPQSVLMKNIVNESYEGGRLCFSKNAAISDFCT
jgi:Txe/YoeB family toxin of Txe-Axe toxin-antitoxin module